MGCPDEAILGQNLTFTAQVTDTSGAPSDAAALPTYSVYEDETGTAILTGTMAKLDDAGTTGFYSEQIGVTTANGFELWKTYIVRATATVGGTAVAMTDHFLVVQTALSATTTTGALTTLANVKTYIGLSGTDDDTLITSLIARATSAIESYCQRTLRSTTYREIFDGTGEARLLLTEYPVTAITMLATGRTEVIRLNNASTDAYNAYVTVDDTNMTLGIAGGTNDGSDTYTLASYTVNTLVTAINAAGKSWTATSLLSDYDAWDAAEILPCMAQSCFDTAYAYVDCPETVEDDFRVEGDSAEIYLPDKFPSGFQNVVVRYTAGYATTPADLEQITIDLVNLYYLSRERDTSVKRERLGDHDITFVESGGGGARDLPEHLAVRLSPYKRYTMGYI